MKNTALGIGIILFATALIVYAAVVTTLLVTR